MIEAHIIVVDIKRVIVILSVVTKHLYIPDNLILNITDTRTCTSLLTGVTVRIRSLSDTLNWVPLLTKQVTIVGGLLLTSNDKLNTGGLALTGERSWKERLLLSIIGSSV